MSIYHLDERLERDSRHIMALSLCELRLHNEARFPWVILVPQRANVTELFQLESYDQQQLLIEIAQVSQVMHNIFQADKLNVAALGNQVSQLHWHVIVRYTTDLAWPNPVWGYFEQTSGYAQDVLKRRIQLIQEAMLTEQL